MKKLYLALFAFTSLVGGWGLLAPAPARSQSSNFVCEDVVRTSCAGYGGVMECTRRNGTTDWLTCDGQFWVWA